MQIVFRGDSDFCREEILKWCEDEDRIDYVIGIAKNNRLKNKIAVELAEAKAEYEKLNKSDYSKASTTERRRAGAVIEEGVCKAEHLEKGSNPRFVVTSLAMPEYTLERVYEELYYPRGKMRTGSRSSSSVFLPTEPVPTGCVRISSGYGYPLWRISC